MIFQTIHIYNLFSYFHKQEIDLTAPDGERNIAIITGRNGHGKTSLLTCLKLLFAGVTESLRRAVQRRRIPGKKQYIVGVGDDWWGIMNRRARRKGETNCGIRICWQESVGKVEAERSWILEGNQVYETLSIQADFLDERLIDNDEFGEASDFLARRLPPSYVDFFLFDGEQIQALAEANRDVQQQQMERLLGISGLDALRDALNKAIRRWKKSAMNPNAKAELQRLEGELRTLKIEKDHLDQKETELKSEIDDLESARGRIQRRMDNLSAFVHREDEAKLKSEQTRLNEEKEELLLKIAEELPRDIVLLTNSTLVKKALSQLNRIVHSEQTTRINLLEELQAILPKQIFGRPAFPQPDISEGQKAFYQYKLIDILEKFSASQPSDADAVFKPDQTASQAALEQLTPYSETDALQRSRVDDFNRLHQKHKRLEVIDKKLLNAASLSTEERLRFEKYKEQIHQMQRDVEEKKIHLKELCNDRDKKETAIHKKNDDKHELEQQVQLNQITENKVKLANRFRSLFGDMKDSRKKERRAELEESINRHFKILMTSHHLINHIELDEDFGLHYLDADGNAIGMGNLSAGMKQLMATALLWSLSEISGAKVPIVVNTPLARIDRKNQEAMLRHYYPAAGRQVIILPTDSEIDAKKFKLISQNVYKTFLLENPEGDYTRINEIDPVQLFKV